MVKPERKIPVLLKKQRFIGDDEEPDAGLVCFCDDRTVQIMLVQILPQFRRRHLLPGTGAVKLFLRVTGQIRDINTLPLICGSMEEKCCEQTGILQFLPDAVQCGAVAVCQAETCLTGAAVFVRIVRIICLEYSRSRFGISR